MSDVSGFGRCSVVRKDLPQLQAEARADESDQLCACSGVVVDICKGHGTWFDREELSRIVEFIRGGGRDAARAREKAALEEERRSLEQLSVHGRHSILAVAGSDDERRDGIASAGSLLKHLLG